jgi:hypothetical protein
VCRVQPPELLLTTWRCCGFQAEGRGGEEQGIDPRKLDEDEPVPELVPRCARLSFLPVAPTSSPMCRRRHGSCSMAVQRADAD